MLVIPFANPPIGLVDDGGAEVFSALETATKQCSKAVGWAIGQGKSLTKQNMASILSRVHERVPQLDARQLQAYACLIFLAKEVWATHCQ